MIPGEQNKQSHKLEKLRRTGIIIKCRFNLLYKEDDEEGRGKVKCGRQTGTNRRSGSLLER